MRNDRRRGGRLAVCQSSDDGQTWHHLADIAPRPGDAQFTYYELHGVEAAPDRLVMQIRNEDKNDQNETLQTQSSDGGKTWAVPHRIGVWGLPSHLLKLRDGRLLMTYGHRRVPLGNQARLSGDQGRRGPSRSSSPATASTMTSVIRARCNWPTVRSCRSGMK